MHGVYGHNALNLSTNIKVNVNFYASYSLQVILLGYITEYIKNLASLTFPFKSH